MSLATWQAEFYEQPAREAARCATNDDEALILHSLQKWRGALPENLARHGCTYEAHTIKERDTFNNLVFKAITCGLCYRHAFTNAGKCVTCPLAQAIGGACDKDTTLVEFTRTWNRSANNPQPMIEALEFALAGLREKQGQK